MVNILMCPVVSDLLLTNIRVMCVACLIFYMSVNLIEPLLEIVSINY